MTSTKTTIMTITRITTASGWPYALGAGYQCPDDPDSKRDGAVNGSNQVLDPDHQNHPRHLQHDHRHRHHLFPLSQSFLSFTYFPSLLLSLSNCNLNIPREKRWSIRSNALSLILRNFGPNNYQFCFHHHFSFNLHQCPDFRGILDNVIYQWMNRQRNQ